jgi:DNA-binding NarL/FixJ family response regulator
MMRIVLADDHVAFREGLKLLVNNQDDMEVVGEAGNGLEAIAVVNEVVPDVVIIDIGMPELNGVEATRRIKATRAEVKVVVLTVHSESRMIAAMRQAGASGYLIKECSASHLIKVIRGVREGKDHFHQPEGASHRRGAKEDQGGSAFDLLSNREREVLQLIAEGHSTKEIADQLGLSAKTVSTHRAHIMEKLGLERIADLTKYAIREGLSPLR